MTLLPAPEDSGIVFVRDDRWGKRIEIRSHFDHVCHTGLGTTLGNGDGETVATVEHLLAALWGAGVDNVRVVLDGPEVPIMDGSAHPFSFLVECAGTEEQAAPRRWLQVHRPVEVADGDSVISLRPADSFVADVTISFPHPMIGDQHFRFAEHAADFRSDLSRARTFGFLHDVERMHAAGLALGGSLDNAVVLDDRGILNEEGLRYADEFVRHKVLDLVGDLYLAGYRLRGHFVGVRPGHRINNRLLCALFADARNWSLVELDESVAVCPAEPSRAIA